MTQATDKGQGYREVNLWLASRRYVTGELERSELEEIENDYTEDFNKAMVAISKRNLSYDLLARVRNIWKPKSRPFLRKAPKRY